MTVNAIPDNIRVFIEWFSNHGGMLHPGVSFQSGKTKSDFTRRGVCNSEVSQGYSGARLSLRRTSPPKRLSCPAHLV